MNRLTIISQVNPQWAVTIYEFISQYPEFSQYQYLAPINSTESIPYKNVNSLFEAILYYICAAGVRYTYAVKQWEIIYPQVSCDSWEKIIENTESMLTNINIQNKKREIYNNICRYMNENNLNHKNLNISHLKNLQKNVSGIGVGCVAWCKKYFTLDDDCVEYTDITFKKGFKKLYDTDALSLRKQKAKEWQEKNLGRIANLMVLQIGGYT